MYKDRLWCCGAPSSLSVVCPFDLGLETGGTRLLGRNQEVTCEPIPPQSRVATLKSSGRSVGL